MVGKLSQISKSSQEALSKFREWFRCPSGGPGVVGSPSRMSVSGLEALPDVR